LIKFKIT